MNTRTLFRGLTVIGILSVGITKLSAGSGCDGLLAPYERDDKKFKRVEIADMTICFHQRMIDEAIVEGDCIVYQFDGNTGELLNKEVRWRGELPEHVTPLITKEEAELMVRGEVQFTRLYFISPESDVFPLKPTPRNPCWVVRSIDDGELIVTIIDAIDGRICGHGIPPPPYTGFSLSGPQYSNPCSGTWISWYQNAEYWFNEMGYSTEAIEWPTEAKVKSHIQSCATAMFYELAHGGSYGFASGCLGGTNYEFTYSSEIHNWIENYTKMPFAFIGSCEGMCDVGSGTFSYEFRKGSMESTATVGYCHMSEPECEGAWVNSLDWQDVMFLYMKHEYTVKEAFDLALVVFPMCVDCMRFTGDESLTVVPVVKRCASIEFIRGDVAPPGAEDGEIKMGDGLAILNYYYGQIDLDCIDAADVDDNGVVTMGDGLRCLNYYIYGDTTLAPEPPFPNCGRDPTEDDLDCASHAYCMGGKGPVSKPSVSVEHAPNKLMLQQVVAEDGIMILPVDLIITEDVLGCAFLVDYDVSKLSFAGLAGGEGYDFYRFDVVDEASGLVRVVCIPDLGLVDIFAPGEYRAAELEFRVKGSNAGVEFGLDEVEVVNTSFVDLPVEWVIKPGVDNLPAEFALSQNYPNPFNATTAISYQLSGVSPHRTTLKVYNIAGQEVRTLVDEEQASGYYSVSWDGRDGLSKEVSSGIYFYRLQAGSYTETKKMVLLK